MTSEVTHRTLSSCETARQFARQFRGSPKLAEELAKLHAQCPGMIEIKSRGLKFVCDCECHKVPPAVVVE